MYLSRRQENALRALVVLILVIIAFAFKVAWAGWLLKTAILVLGIIISFPLLVEYAPRIDDFFYRFYHFQFIPFMSRIIKWLVNYRKQCLIAVAVIILIRIIGFIYTQKTWANETLPETVCNGVTYERKIFKGCRIHILKVNLAKAKPVVLGVENFTFGKMQLSELANKQYLAEVLVNGDLFDEGGPQGFFSPGHRITGANTDRAALEFIKGRKADVELYRFSTLAGVSVNGNHYPIKHCYNSMYVPGDVGVYTYTRGAGSGAKRSKHLMQARVLLANNSHEGSVYLHGTMTGIVTNPSGNLIPNSGEVIITAGNESWQGSNIGPYNWAKNCWQKNARVYIDLSMTPAPDNQVISGGPEIMRFGKYMVNEPKNEWCLSRTARTAVGISGDRQRLLVIVAEGQPKWGDRDLKHCPKLFLRALGIHVLHIFPGFTGISKGASTRTLFRFFSEEGYPHAINLDGGSSTTLVKKQHGTFKVTNTLMEGEEPLLTTALGFAPR
jgi:hypothetical protein